MLRNYQWFHPVTVIVILTVIDCNCNREFSISGFSVTTKDVCHALLIKMKKQYDKNSCPMRSKNIGDLRFNSNCNGQRRVRNLIRCKCKTSYRHTLLVSCCGYKTGLITQHVLKMAASSRTASSRHICSQQTWSSKPQHQSCVKQTIKLIYSSHFLPPLLYPIRQLSEFQLHSMLVLVL